MKKLIERITAEMEQAFSAAGYDKKYAKVTQKGVVRAKKKGIGHTIKVYAKAKDKSKKKAYCKVRIYK